MRAAVHPDAEEDGKEQTDERGALCPSRRT